MTDTETDTLLSPPLNLTQDPARIAAYLKQQRTDADDDTPSTFADFISGMKMTDFENVFDIRAVLESQAHTLGAMFQYLMIEGDWRSLPMALRAQKMMMDTIDTMNGYPSDAYRRSFKPSAAVAPATDDTDA